MELKLSIIVPVNNVEPYLTKCINSLLNQDLLTDEYEIIMIEDGSKDNSAKLADDYANKYKNIYSIHKANEGLSAARNAGIKLARGKYIQFVDSDDFLEPNVLKYLVDKMEQDKLDILRFNYQTVNENYEIYEPYKEHKPFVDYNDEICDGLTFLTERLGYGCYSCQFMIKSELLKNNEKNYFKFGIFFEDTEWTPRILLKANKVTSTNKMVYNYLQRVGSMTKSVNIEKKRKVINDKIIVIKSLQEQMVNKSDKRWYEGMISAMVISIMQGLADDFYIEKEKYIDILNQMNVFPLSTYHATKSGNRKIKFINFSPKLFCLLMHLKRMDYV